MYRRDMWHVLVVEDEPPILRNIVARIETTHANFSVTHTASSGRMAIELLQSEHFDVIFLDIHLALITGLDVLQFIHEHRLPIYAVILSGHEDFKYAQKAIEYNAFAYMVKPLDKDELASILTKLHITLNKAHSIVASKQESPPNIDTDYTHFDSKENLALTIKKHIETNYHLDITGQTLADEFHFVPSYISTIFKKFYRMSPTDFLTKTRIEEAKKLISHTDLPFKHIARSVGYANPLYFSKVFKKVTGTSPSEYRQDTMPKERHFVNQD